MEEGNPVHDETYNQLIDISEQVGRMKHDLDKIADKISKIIQPEIEKQQL